MSALYAVLNPVVKCLLRSPLHGLMSRNTMIVRYTGRRSGKTFEIPISYAVIDGALVGFTAREGRWWRNFEQGGSAQLLVAGSWRDATAEALETGDTGVQTLLAGFLRAVPRDAAPAGVGMQGGEPVAADVTDAAGRLIALRFHPKEAL